jgi:hypothetical protein
MYAAYLNQNYPTGLNPARFLLAVNGTKFAAGYWDSKPVLEGPVFDLRPQTTVLTDLQEICGRNVLDNHALKCLAASVAKEFLKRLYNAIFDRRRNISRVLEAVAGKDVRKALEIFVAIITSGYLSTLTIASNTMGAGAVTLKEHTILRILMRTNRRLFSNDSGFVQNIFAYDATSKKPDNFILIEILFFLFSNRKMIGLINLEGYFTCQQVADALQKLGYVPDDVFLAIGNLVRSELIITDRLNTRDVRWEDSVRIWAAGWVHLRILTERFEYIYGCILTTPIHDQRAAEQLADLVSIESQRGHLDFHQQLRAVDTFYRYLWTERNKTTTPFNEGPQSGADYVLKHILGALELTRSSRPRPAPEDILDF